MLSTAEINGNCSAKVTFYEFFLCLERSPAGIKLARFETDFYNSPQAPGQLDAKWWHRRQMRKMAGCNECIFLLKLIQKLMTIFSKL